jgi:hypothetical protein
MQEAPTKFVTIGVSPFLISLGMVCGVLVARWTLPTILKGTGYIFRDLREKSHLIIWGLLAGALWSVANTLSAFAIRDVGDSVDELGRIRMQAMQAFLGDYDLESAKAVRLTPNCHRSLSQTNP